MVGLVETLWGTLGVVGKDDVPCVTNRKLVLAWVANLTLRLHRDLHVLELAIGVEAERLALKVANTSWSCQESTKVGVEFTFGDRDRLGAQVTSCLLSDVRVKVEDPALYFVLVHDFLAIS